MNIGKLIKKLRVHSAFSRAELTTGICTEKFLYLIETGKRNPSVHVLTQFSDRMSINIFDWIPYSDCEDPVTVKTMIDGLIKTRNESKIEALKVLIENAKGIKDFAGNAEFRFEVFLSEVFIIACEGHDLDKIIGFINTTYKVDQDKMSLSRSCDLSKINRIRMDNLIAINLMENGQVEKGVSIFEQIYEEINFNSNLNATTDIQIRLALNYCRALLITEQYDKAEIIARTVLEVQKFNKVLADQFSTYFYLSQALYHKGRFDEAVDQFRSFIFSGVIQNAPNFFKSTVQHPFSKEIIDEIQKEVDLIALCSRI